MTIKKAAHPIDRAGIGLAVVSGLLLTAAFPKWDLGWAAMPALVPLLFAVRRLRPADAFRLGFVAGTAHYLSLLYWLVHTMNVYGQLPLFLCVPILFLLGLLVGPIVSLSVPNLCYF